MPAITGSAHGEAMDVTAASWWQSLRDSPRGLPLRAVLVAAVAMAVARAHAAHNPGVLCPLRLLTGVPCPLCGSTTAFVELGQGHLRSALAAQPVIMALTAVLVAAPALFSRAARRYACRPRLVLSAVAVVAAASWVYQFFRFGLL